MILLVDEGRYLFKIFRSLLGHLIWTLHIIFSARDHSLYGYRPVLFLVEIQFFDSLLHKRELVIGVEDHKRFIQSQGREIAGFNTQYTSANGMKGANSHLFGLVDTHQLFQALAHLFGSFICEGDGQDAPGRNMLVLHQVRDAVSNSAGLSAAWTRQDEDRSFGGGDSLPLWFVESCHQVL